MLLHLPETIQTFSSESRKTVGSLIQSIKADKAQISALIQNLRSFDIGANYNPSLALKYSRLELEGIVEFFRDSSLRVGRFFNASAAVSNIANSIVAIYTSEVEKLEKDINYLENFIDNYQFIVGEDDLYNFNYIENFDSDINSDKSGIQIVDRDGISFNNNGNYYIDSSLGKMSISTGIEFTNQYNNISSTNYLSNYSNYSTTDTGFHSVFNEDKLDHWTVTVKSPVVLSSKLEESTRYISYDDSYINRSTSFSRN